MAIESLGEIETPIGTLRCTLRAFENISNRLGSFGEAYKRVAEMDIFAMAVVASEAQGLTIENVKELIWRTGSLQLVGPFGKYLTMLSNGGKMPDDSGKDATSGEF